MAEIANVADATAKARLPDWLTISGHDGYVFTAPEGSFRVNPFGLCDMHGNVWEWCADYYDPDYYDTSPAVDPQGPSTGSHRVFRGGGYNSLQIPSRCAYRGHAPADFKDLLPFGFRIALDASERNP